MGFQSRQAGNKLVYAMRVDEERLHFDKYFHDERFQAKKPDLSGPWERICGDNMYWLDENGDWQQLKSLHDKPVDKAKDTKYPYAYVADHYYYFGEEAIKIPPEFAPIIRTCRSCKCNHSVDSTGLIDWLEDHFQTGIIGLPRDRHKGRHCKFPLKHKVKKTKYMSIARRSPPTIAFILPFP